jgi:Tfp pilus assembly protein PilF
VNLASTYMNQDRLKMARQSLLQAIEMDPDLAAAHEALGYCLFRSRDFGAAERAYDQALTCDWRLPRAHAGLGSIAMIHYLEDKARTEYRDLALEHWHRSLELNPDQPRIRKLITEYKPQRDDPESLLLDDRGKP